MAHNKKSVALVKQFINEVLSGFGVFSLGKNGPSNVMRYDDTRTAHSNGNILDDEEDELSRVKRAACCLIVADDRMVLAVSRKDNPSAMGLPGGKVDPGESPEDACIRELMEETGLHAVKVTPVYSAKDPHGYLTTTFACEVEGEINTEEAGVVRWVSIDTLLNSDHSPFHEYNSKLFGRLGWLK